ncbi:MAG: hypothetical protein EB127_31320 [Alphaproteobacteria bacterium]|nr:hypothetical protein [Alphaproteobacteria bacterium]
MYSNIQQAVASVQNAFPSIYTKDDVIKLLESIEISEEKVSSSLTNSQIEELCKRVVAQVKENADNLDSSDVVDTSTAEFSLSYNEIQLDSVDIDTRNIVDEVVNGIGDVIEEFFEELAEENEQETLEIPKS